MCFIIWEVQSFLPHFDIPGKEKEETLQCPFPVSLSTNLSAVLSTGICTIYPNAESRYIIYQSIFFSHLSVSLYEKSTLKPKKVQLHFISSRWLILLKINSTINKILWCIVGFPMVSFTQVLEYNSFLSLFPSLLTYHHQISIMMLCSTKHFLTPLVSQLNFYEDIKKKIENLLCQVGGSVLS